jgi:hypothetical protein
MSRRGFQQAIGIWVHTWQGLYNLHSVMWNGGAWGETLGDLNIDEHHEYLFDWRYPQMLASESMIRNRFHEHGLRALPQTTPAF